MNKHRDKFRHFARGRHRKGKFMRLAMVFLPLLLLFSMCSAFMGHCGHGHGRHGRHGEHSEFYAGHHSESNRTNKRCRHNCDAQEASGSTNAPVSTPQANAANEDEPLDELMIIQDALDRAVTGEDITVQQRNLIMAQETRRFTEKKENEQKNEEETPAAAASSNSSNQTASQAQVRGERRHHRHRGFSPIGFLLGGLLKLGLLFFLLSFIAKRFGFRPWRQSLGFRRWQEAYADAWGEPVSRETPVAPEEDEEEDDIARELEREEQRQQAQQAQQKKAKEDQAAKKSEDVSDDSKPEDKNAA